MKSLDNFYVKQRCCGRNSFFRIFIGLFLLLASCNERPEPYSILEFTGNEGVSNYSKSYFLAVNISDSLNPTAIIGSRGDLLACGEYGFVYDDTSSQNKFSINFNNGVLFVNGKISSIDIPGNDDMIPWFKNLKDLDLSALQFINFDSEIKENYLPYLAELAEIRPDAGISYSDNFGDLNELLKIFNPRYIIGPSLLRSDYDMLKRLTRIEMLMVSLEDSVIYDPLPPLPSMEQLFLTGMDEDVLLADNFLINNKQIKKVIIEKSGSLDLALLKPVKDLKELVVKITDSITNPDLINDHEKLEVLSLTGHELVYDPGLLRLPDLRWMTFSSNVTQEEFNTFIGTHPDLEVIGLIANDTITSLQPLLKLNKLFGLTITGTVRDISTIQSLRNLKYLSLPDDFLNKTMGKAELQKSLPDTRIVANEGFCLGSGWLLLLIPLVLLFRFFYRQVEKGIGKG